MRIDLYGLAFETPRVTVTLWTPWRASALEHRLYEAVAAVPGVRPEPSKDGLSLEITEPKPWKAALGAIARVLKGWQEEADPGSERRSWRWLLEGDTDAYGYDHANEPASLWALVRVSVDRGGPGDDDKGEDVELDGFSIRLWPANKA
jgi:hypothetical protein